jgi:hypothetical protein
VKCINSKNFNTLPGTTAVNLLNRFNLLLSLSGYLRAVLRVSLKSSSRDEDDSDSESTFSLLLSRQFSSALESLSVVEFLSCSPPVSKSDSVSVSSRFR